MDVTFQPLIQLQQLTEDALLDEGVRCASEAGDGLESLRFSIHGGFLPKARKLSRPEKWGGGVGGTRKRRLCTGSLLTTE